MFDSRSRAKRTDRVPTRRQRSRSPLPTSKPSVESRSRSPLGNGNDYSCCITGECQHVYAAMDRYRREQRTATRKESKECTDKGMACIRHCHCAQHCPALGAPTYGDDDYDEYTKNTKTYCPTSPRSHVMVVADGTTEQRLQMALKANLELTQQVSSLSVQLREAQEQLSEFKAFQCGGLDHDYKKGQFVVVLVLSEGKTIEGKIVREGGFKTLDGRRQWHVVSKAPNGEYSGSQSLYAASQIRPQ